MITLTDRQRRSAIEAHSSEATIKEIAERFGIPTSVLLRLWKEAGLGKRERVRLSREPAPPGTKRKKPARHQRIGFGRYAP